MNLAEDERDLLMREVSEAAEQIRQPERRALYGELLTAVDSGQVPDDLLEPLQTLLEVGLESGRIRRVHSAHGEMAAARLYARTPRGRELRAAADAVNDALKGLEGQQIQELRVAVVGPSSYSVAIGTDRGTLQLQLGRNGVRVQSLEVGG